MDNLASSTPRSVVFLDETWIYSKGNKGKSWQDNSGKSVRKPEGYDGRTALRRSSYSIGASHCVYYLVQTFPLTSNKMSRFPLIVVFLVIVGFAAAQLNYSPDWGKRSQNNFFASGCKPSVETTMTIFKLIQAEAQKLLECEKMK
ncbi:Adipokinetic hormone [Popillia japonica]|uniref:Adipokinetic hormone n=1 Tax=Popillia japonica TaxID=7064 RepID=A0AAW1JES8_POPJA